jgi:hypothetical protein
LFRIFIAHHPVDVIFVLTLIFSLISIVVSRFMGHVLLGAFGVMPGQFLHLSSTFCLPKELIPIDAYDGLGIKYPAP